MILLFIKRSRNLSTEILHYKYELLLNKEDSIRKLNKMRRFRSIPKEICELIINIKGKYKNEKIKLLEIGSGPQSNLAYYVDNNIFDVVGIDPNANTYSKILKELNYDYPINPLNIPGENLLNHFEKNYFHIVFAQNSLDHTQDPIKCLENSFLLLKKFGLLYIKSNVKEGSRKSWMGLHKHDIFFQNDKLFLSNKKKKVTNLLGKYENKFKLVYFQEHIHKLNFKKIVVVYVKL